MASSGRRVIEQAALPAVQEEEINIVDLFRSYQESCRLRLAACGDDPGLRLGALEPLVQELLQQNEVLIQSIRRLQEDCRTATVPPSSLAPLADDHQGSLSREAPPQQVTRGRDRSPEVGHVSASEVIRELNSHLTSLQIENNMLRDKNDNLENDIENLLDMIEFERNARTVRDGIQEEHASLLSQSIAKGSTSGEERRTDADRGTVSKVLMFSDSLTPEDVYGPIESLSDGRQAAGQHSATAGNDSHEGNERRTSLQGGTEHSLKSLDDSWTGKESSGISSGADSSLTGGKTSGCSDAGSGCRKQAPTAASSTCSLASSNLQLVLEEKELLIADLQQHLESVSRQSQLTGSVIKTVEQKLADKRRECNEWRSKAFAWQRSLNDHIKENMELKERILVLNDHKRCLMTRLDAESDACRLAHEELLLLRRRSSQLMQQNEFQSMTIEHLKEAIIAKTRALSAISSPSASSSSPTLSRLSRDSTIQL